MADRFSDYFPTDQGEQDFLTYLQGPGDDLGMFLGDEERVKMEKALPKKDAETKEAEGKSKKPPSKASSKKTGATGKTRYSYPGEEKPDPKKKEKSKGGPAEKREAEPGSPAQGEEQESGPVQAPVKADPAVQSADPQKFAQQVGMDVNVLKKMAKKFQDKKELGGRSGFQDFMTTQLKAFMKKHKQIDRDYFGLLFDNLLGK